jgi:hypothetical protein
MEVNLTDVSCSTIQLNERSIETIRMSIYELPKLDCRQDYSK